jgi:uncharacterized membrane protein (UPF0127 family)
MFARKQLMVVSSVIIGLLVFSAVLGENSGVNLCLGRHKCINLEVADSEFEQKIGLSGRRSLASDQGMLFVFSQPDFQCFWMKDMLFDIDMIWLNDQKIVIGIDKNVPKESYPKNFCHDGVSYVVELVSGQADNLGLKIGSKLNF